MSFYSIIKFVILIIMIQNIPFTNALYPSLCGLKFKDKVIGGTEVESNSWPWMVSIHYNFQHICGGTLINNEFILTAAHCILYPSAVSAYKIVLGGHNISEAGVNTNAVRLGLNKIIVHEDFYQPYYLNDVALLKLHKPVEFSREIFPACMPSTSDNFENTICHFIGWGYTHPTGNVPNTPKEITLPILSQEECSKYAFAAVEQKYCSGAMGSYQDTCKGDSGGGQMCVKSDGRWYVGGIVSYGAGACGNVGIQARVDYQRRWIDKNVAENSS